MAGSVRDPALVQAGHAYASNVSGWRWRWLLKDGPRDVARLDTAFALMGGTFHQDGEEYDIVLRGILRWRVEATDAKGDIIATMTLGWAGNAAIVLADGRKFEWRAESMWGNRWSLLLDGEPIARVRSKRWASMDTEVEVLATRIAEHDLALLLAMGWFGTALATMGASGVVIG